MAEIIDRNPVWLGCRVEDGSLQIEHDTTPLANGEVTVLLDTRADTCIALADFEHEGEHGPERCRVNAFTIRDDGSLEEWPHTGEGVCSPLIRPGDETFVLHMIIVPVAYELAGTVTARDMESHQPDSWQALVRVRVPPRGTKPGE